MKIGLFTDCYYPQINGVVTSVMLLRDELIKQGHEVTVITVKVPGHTKDEDGVIRINSIPFSRWKEFRVAIPFIFSIYLKIKHLNFDIIHTHTEFTIGLMGRFFSMHLQIPMVHTYHTIYEDYTHYVASIKTVQSLVKKIIVKGSREYVKPATAVIVPTEKTKKLMQKYKIKSPIYILPTGIDLEKFGKPDHKRVIEIRKNLSINKDTSVILVLGRISEEKSIDLVVRSMPDILKKIPSARLIVVGDGPFRKNLEEISHDLNITDKVRFTGRVCFDEVPDYYAIADVFVSASKTETQGLTICEAMASGTPVAVYDDENIAGIVSHDISGILFKTADELTGAVINILTDHQKAQFLANEGLKSIHNLSKEAFARNAVKIYRDLIALHYEDPKYKSDSFFKNRFKYRL